MISRTYTPDFLNSVINDPSVRDGAEVKGIGDIADIVRNLHNQVLVTEHGGFIGIKKLPGLYECHTQFLPEGRGLHAVEAAREAMRYMFLWTDCDRIVTKAHVDNKAVQRFTSQFFRRRGQSGDYLYYSLDIDDWIGTDAECESAGRAFHDLIGDKKDHADDKVHDCFVGYTWLTAKTGNIYKAQLQYNRWAVMAGYAPIVILSERPLIVAMGDMQLIMSQEGIQCL